MAEAALGGELRRGPLPSSCPDVTACQDFVLRTCIPSNTADDQELTVRIAWCLERPFGQQDQVFPLPIMAKKMSRSHMTAENAQHQPESTLIHMKLNHGELRDK